MPPPSPQPVLLLSAVLLLTVAPFSTPTSPLSLQIPPPLPVAVLSLTVAPFAIVTSPPFQFQIPPPLTSAILLLTLPLIMTSPP